MGKGKGSGFAGGYAAIRQSGSIPSTINSASEIKHYISVGAGTARDTDNEGVSLPKEVESYMWSTVGRGQNERYRYDSAWKANSETYELDTLNIRLDNRSKSIKVDTNLLKNLTSSEQWQFRRGLEAEVTMKLYNSRKKK